MCRWTWDLQIIKLHYNYIYFFQYNLFENFVLYSTRSRISDHLAFCRATIPYIRSRRKWNWHHIFFGYHFGFPFGYVPEGNGVGGAKRGWGFRLEGKILTLKILTLLIPFSQRKGNAFIYHAEKTVFLLHGYSSHTVSLIYNLGLCNA